MDEKNFPVKEPGKTGLEALQSLPRFESEGLNFPSSLSRGLYSFKFGQFEYDFIYTPGRENRLFVLFSGYVDRQRLELPVFQRWSWAKYFPGHCLYIADPTLKLSRRLGLGWYVGTRDEEVLPVLTELIRHVAGCLGIDLRNVIGYASSGGGFAILQISRLMPEITVITINPQVDITLFDNSGVPKFLEVCFGGISKEDAIARFPSRLSVIPGAEQLAQNRILYAQNTMDEHHMDVHFKLFADTLGLTQGNHYCRNLVKTMFFVNPGGHAKAEPPELLPELLQAATDLSKS